MSGRIPWGRVLVEGAVIVVSILLAFAIDAWWARLGEQAQERLALAGLEADFAGYLVALADTREDNRERTEVARTLMSFGGPDPVDVDEDEFQALLGRALAFSSIILPSGTLGSLMETDGLSLISDDTLRSELVAWTQDLQRAEERNDYLVEQSRELDAFLKPRYPMADILRHTQAKILGVPVDASTYPPGFPVDATSLLADQEFANHIAFAEDASLLVIQSVDHLAERANRILSLLREETAAR